MVIGPQRLNQKVVGPGTLAGGVADDAELVLTDTQPPRPPLTRQERQDRLARRQLRDLDAALPRAVEDLIDALEASHGLDVTKLSQAVRDTLAAKRAARAKLSAGQESGVVEP